MSPRDLRWVKALFPWLIFGGLILPDAITLTVRRVHKEIAERVDTIIENTASYMTDIHTHESDGEVCDFSKAAVGTYLHALTIANLWPTRSRCKTLRQVFSCIEMLRVPDITLASPCTACRRAMIAGFEFDVREMQTAAKDIFTAVCLDCLKPNGYDGQPCRASHNGEWVVGKPMISNEWGAPVGEKLQYRDAKI